ncbi:MAG: hypothetical protein KJ077_11050 [Anaerolineae bacterium]|nr:hypothetical protein [Anaerolineae bacterium]
MPYMHPVLGVPCATIFEVAEHLAEVDGTDPGEELDNFFRDISESELADADRLLADLRKDPSPVLKELFDWFDCDEDDPLRPFLVLEVQHVEVAYRFTSTTTKYLGLAQFNDNQPRRFKLVTCDSSGTWYEPPDYEVEVEYWPEEVPNAPSLSF